MTLDLDVLLSKIILWAGALIFIAIGVIFTFTPTVLPLSGIELPTGPSRIEFRAVYGGIEAGIGVFLALCATRSAWVQPGLAAAALISGGAGLARCVGFAAEAIFDPANAIFGGVELAGGLLAWWALARERHAH